MVKNIWIVAARSPDEPPREQPRRQVAAGTSVEVRGKLVDSWRGGFEVVEVLDHAYRVRRIADDAVLPVPLDAIDVRPR